MSTTETATDLLTMRVRTAVVADLHAGIAAREATRQRLAEADEDAQALLARLARVDALTSEFEVRIRDTAVSTYSHGAEEADETRSSTGLRVAVKEAEAAFKARHGSIRTDGWVRYEVHVLLAGTRVPVDVSLWQSFTCQSATSLRRAASK